MPQTLAPWMPISTHICATLAGASTPPLFSALPACLVMSDSLRPFWTGACQAPPPKGFSRQEYWSRLSFSSPEDFPVPGIEPLSPESPVLQADSLPAEP